MKEKQTSQISNFRWCEENDFMVFIRPESYDHYGKGSKASRVYVRVKGITTEGKDYIYKNGLRIESKLIPGKKVFKTPEEAWEAAEEVQAKLRERYGDKDE